MKTVRFDDKISTYKDAKENVGILAKKVIEWSGAKRPLTPLKHDAAEVILTGLWGGYHIGWIRDLPPDIKKIL